MEELSSNGGVAAGMLVERLHALYAVPYSNIQNKLTLIAG